MCGSALGSGVTECCDDWLGDCAWLEREWLGETCWTECG
jgi:hypothetical protein